MWADPRDMSGSGAIFTGKQAKATRGLFLFASIRPNDYDRSY